MENITVENFKNIIENNHIVIIDFWADWCNPCVALGPIMEKVSKNYPNIFFGKVHVDEQMELAQAFEVRSIPYVVKIVDGKFVDSFLGLHPENFVETWVAKEV